MVAVTGLHEALERLAAGDEAAAAAELLLAIRVAERAEPGAGVAALRHFLANYPHYRRALRAWLRRLLGDHTAAALYAETGILANTGFGTELMRRLTGKLLPPPRDETLRGVFVTVFDSRDDSDWLAAVPGESWLALWRDFLEADAEVDNAADGNWSAAWQALADALDMLSVRVAALGIEPELLRHYRVPLAHDNPFLAQNAETQRWLEGLRTGTAVIDTAQLEVLLDQCAAIGEQVRRSARHSGASFALTFALRRLTQMLTRMRTLMSLLAARGAGNGAADGVAARITFAIELVRAEADGHGIREHLRAGTDLIALQVTENASRTGEHYITRSRREYLAMFRAALGAGGIIGAMALGKTLLAGLHLPLLIEALAFSLNYAFGFVLIYVLHFTIATKQPAMTAQTIAAHMSASRPDDHDAVAQLIAQVARTQFVAVLGNVLLAMPVACAVTWLVVSAGAHAPAAKAPELVAELHPWASPALFHAAIAGVWLFCAGLVSGYVDNLAAYERIGDRVRGVRWLARLGGARRERFADWLQDHLGGVAGNVFFGFALGMTGFVGVILGLPLDIRHVTFSAANLAIAWVGSDFALAAAVLGISLLGVVLIAVTNVAVSFALALWVAFRARGENFSDMPALLAALWRQFRRAPWSFLLPPKQSSPD